MTTEPETAPAPESAPASVPASAPAASGKPAAPAPGPGADTAVGFWLLSCAVMVFFIVIIGGITRLTHSGLSMVEWKPLIGVLPPLSEIEWNRVFGLYQLTPEYLQVNQGMTLEAFKEIFWWEWFHRLFAHLIGFVFLLPFLYFWATKKIRPGVMTNLINIFLLGALQGVVGWLMVASGLVDRPAVSHYRLATHLTMAVLIFSFILWQALELLRPEARSALVARNKGWSLRMHLRLAFLLATATLIWGALVAGLHAGLIYNTFPLMNGSFIAGEAWALEPKWLNLFENAPAVQFCHRWLALTTGLVVLSYGWRVASIEALAPATRRLGFALGAWVIVQISLGITTLVLSVPVATAVTHQGGAFVLLSLILLALHDLRRR